MTAIPTDRLERASKPSVGTDSGRRRRRQGGRVLACSADSTELLRGTVDPSEPESPSGFPYSKNRVTRAGTALRRHLYGDGPVLSPQEFAEEIAVVEAFRRLHNAPAVAARLGLESCIRSEGLHVLEVGQRLKRLPTTLDKLRRQPNLQLANLHDLGGCRAVFATQAEARLVQQRLVRNGLKRNGRSDKVKDYVAAPKRSGYRAVHIVTHYQGKLVEVQLRTERQHEWTMLVEGLVVRTGVDYKSGEGSEDVHRWLRHLSDWGARLDAGQPINNRFLTDLAGTEEAAFAEIARNRRGHSPDGAESGAASRPDARAEVASHAGPDAMPGRPATTHFLITFDRAAGRMVGMERYHHGPTAVDGFEEREHRYDHQPHIEVVLLGAASEEAIRVTHSVYFETDFSLEGMARRARRIGAPRPQDPTPSDPATATAD